VALLGVAGGGGHGGDDGRLGVAAQRWLRDTRACGGAGWVIGRQ
jgi:hypothetical protein